MNMQANDIIQKFLERVSSVYGTLESREQIALNEARMLWLAWRGNEDYLTVHIASEKGKESAWQIIPYCKLPYFFDKYESVEARTFGNDFDDHIVTFLYNYIRNEMDKAAVELYAEPNYEEIGNPSVPVHVRIEAIDLFDNIKSKKIIVIKWPSNETPELFSRILVLSATSIKNSKFPGLEKKFDPRQMGGKGFMKFIKREELSSRRRRKRFLIRWVLHG